IRVVTDPAYLVARSFVSGPHAAEADLRQAARVTESSEIAWWQWWFAQLGYLLTGLPTLADTAATATSRLTNASPFAQPDRLRALLPARFLIPVWGLPLPRRAQRRVLTGHTGVVNGVAFSPDGRLLVTGGEDGSV